MAYEIFIHWKFRGNLPPVVQRTLFHNRVVKSRRPGSEKLAHSENVSEHDIYFLTRNTRVLYIFEHPSHACNNMECCTFTLRASVP